ncbi:MAG: glycoside hydrolase family 88 protein [Chitinophagaceae bacterium]|nr:glycoside hydrolase family 88 protein [Chitinophagaceae bacterium]
MKKQCSYLLFAAGTIASAAMAQPRTGNDVTTPLHALRVEYPVPYEPMSRVGIKQVLDRVFNYLDAVTPAQMIDKRTGEEVADKSKMDTNSIIRPGDFRLTSYEWGVTYSGMLLAGETTGDIRYRDYVKKRFDFFAEWIPTIKKAKSGGLLNDARNYPFRQAIEPKALDDAGAVCAAMIKAQRAGLNTGLRPFIDNYIDFVANKEYRLSDGTLARVRPQKNTLWLDDLYMGVPALAQMGKLTGNNKYFDDAVKQVRQFTQRMFNKDLNLYMHGWVENRGAQPEFRWARANGWALMAKVELLDVLPEQHPGRAFVLQQLRAHVKGLTALQDGTGFWHQLLDRNDTYLETSATAIYAYCIARACNKGWLDPVAYAPAAMLAWNAVATKVNVKGQVEGVCVGTGMAFDPAFYYFRPVNVFAAHGYGPVLLAGAEVYRMMEKEPFKINDSALQYYK